MVGRRLRRDAAINDGFIRRHSGMTYCVAVSDHSHSTAINEKQSWHSYVERMLVFGLCRDEASIKKSAQVAAEVAMEDSYDR